MLTLEKLKEMQQGIFEQGYTIDNHTGVNMSGSNKRIKYVCVRGLIHDWAIYVGNEDWSWEEIAMGGDKITDDSNIKRLIIADIEAMEMYRKR